MLRLFTKIVNAAEALDSSFDERLHLRRAS